MSRVSAVTRLGTMPLRAGWKSRELRRYVDDAGRLQRVDDAGFGARHRDRRVGERCTMAVDGPERLELGLAREAMAANRFGLARRRLAHLAERWTDDGEVLVLLGECELVQGRREEALKALAASARAEPILRPCCIPPSHSADQLGPISPGRGRCFAPGDAPRPRPQAMTSRGPCAASIASKGGSTMCGGSFADPGAGALTRRGCSGSSGCSTTHRCRWNHGGRRRRPMARMTASGWAERGMPWLQGVSPSVLAG